MDFIKLSEIFHNNLQWTGLGCDCCGFGSIENIDEFNPQAPCPECGEIMIQEKKHESNK